MRHQLLSVQRRSNASPSRLVLRLDVERERDGRWIVDVVDLPGVMAYGSTYLEARNSAVTLALRVIDERREHGEEVPDFDGDFDPAVEHAHVHHAH